MSVVRFIGERSLNPANSVVHPLEPISSQLHGRVIHSRAGHFSAGSMIDHGFGSSMCEASPGPRSEIPVLGAIEDINASNLAIVLPSKGSSCVPEPATPSVRTAIQTSRVGVGLGVGIWESGSGWGVGLAGYNH